MTDTKKLNSLINYIKDAERHYLDMASKGSVENGLKSMAIQDILLFAENELEISPINWNLEIMICLNDRKGKNE